MYMDVFVFLLVRYGCRGVCFGMVVFLYWLALFFIVLNFRRFLVIILSFFYNCGKLFIYSVDGFVVCVEFMVVEGAFSFWGDRVLGVMLDFRGFIDKFG